MDVCIGNENILSIDPEEFEMPTNDKLRRLARALSIEDMDTGINSENEPSYSATYTVYSVYGALF